MKRFLMALASSSLAALPLGSLCPFVVPAHAQITGRTSLAPLPAAVGHARKVFLLNGQTTAQYLTKNGNILAFDTLYADMESWGKYELVGSPTDADIVIELQYRPYSRGSRSFGTYNPSANTVQTRSVDQIGADFALVIYDAKSKEQLWSGSDACRAALKIKNQQKEVIRSVGRLVDDLKARTQPGSK